MAMRLLRGDRLHDSDNPLSVDEALRYAWRIWFVLLVIPFVVFLAVIWYLNGHESPARMRLSQIWLVSTMAFMAVGVPGAFFWQSRLFRGYWSGQLVSPRDYLAGMVSIWTSLEVGGLLALLGCLVSGQLLPNLIPALLAFALFIPLWPSGHAMTHPPRNEQDPADYSEPR
jgi:hypothetical protein